MRAAIGFIILVIAAFLVMDFNGRVAVLKRLEAQEDLVEAQYHSREATVAALTEKRNQAQSPAAVVQYALANHMAKPGDHPVVILQGEEYTPPPVVTTVEPEIEESNFESWLSLFIEPSAP